MRDYIVTGTPAPTPYNSMLKEVEGNENLDEVADFIQGLLDRGCQMRFDEQYPDGVLSFTKALVEKMDGFKIEIFHKEHGVPHFSVKHKSGDFSATISILEFKLLAGSLPTKVMDMVYGWYRHAGGKNTLIKKWNATRPSDCPVGAIAHGSY